MTTSVVEVPEQATSAAENRIDRVAEGKVLSDRRRESLRRAVGLGVTDEVLRLLIEAVKLNQGPTIKLPAEHYESLSRGRGWCRFGKGRGDTQWGERESGGYRVGKAGRWYVGASDGFSRRSETPWDVDHLTVGSETWTVAS
jgi:hypothetical protein